MRAAAIFGLSFLALGPIERAEACSTLTPAGEAKEARQQRQYLRTHADRSVIGTWHLLEEGSDENGFFMRGYIELADRRRAAKYRVWVPGEINCGFPFYFLAEGDHGRFYLRHDRHADRRDDRDGYIDRFDYVHFEPLRVSS